MKTKRAISTISYNSDMFLSVLFPRLRASNIIDWAHWIRHAPEGGDEDRKSHVHLIVQPSKMIDTIQLEKEFFEVDTQNPGKLLGVTVWRYSKIEDWILYGIHDSGYLASKGQSREKHYDVSQIQSTSPEFLMEQYRTIDMRSYGLGAKVQEAIKSGRSWENFIISGSIPSRDWRYWKEIWIASGGAVRGLAP